MSTSNGTSIASVIRDAVQRARREGPAAISDALLAVPASEIGTFLHATFDGNPVLPKPLRMAGVRRNASTSGTMQTRLQADCVPLQPLDVQFRDYRRVQLKE